MDYDVIIIGAGAAGLFCAITAAKRGLNVCVLEKSKKAAKKIRISGGGRCNFTNLYVSAENYLSENPHFCKSALSRFTPYDFIAYVESKGLHWHEKHQGQLFCDEKANAIAEALLEDCANLGVAVQCNIQVSKIDSIAALTAGFRVTTTEQTLKTGSVVIATGGPSIPKMGATDFALAVAKQFGLPSYPFVAALVPFVLSESDKFSGCEGVSLPVAVTVGTQTFVDAMLITHKGLSGPAILQISSYWQAEESLHINWLPAMASVSVWLAKQGGRPLVSVLKKQLPNRLARHICQFFPQGNIAEFSQAQRDAVLRYLTDYTVVPVATEGMRVAEVSRGGVSTDEISSKTFEAKQVSGLYFVGESLEVTGHLGGYNFQWAWASGFCAGKALGKASKS